MKNELNVPVLFLIFNRLDTTQQVFEEIRKAKPKKLFVAADGPRNKEEKKKTDAVRKFILDNIDWNCEVKTLFRKKNLGCGKAVSQAITWFFKNEEMGIILEDDCLPSQSFFPFCEELLKKYKNNEKIMHISGSNFMFNNKFKNNYSFSKYPYIWGWATWRRAWKKYDYNLKDYKQEIFVNNLNSIFNNHGVTKFWNNLFNTVKNGLIDTWDYQWVYLLLVNNGLSIVPGKNLVKNIGFNSSATNTKKNNKYLLVELENLVIENHPKIRLNKDYDEYVNVYCFGINNSLGLKLNKIIYKIGDLIGF